MSRTIRQQDSFVCSPTFLTASGAWIEGQVFKYSSKTLAERYGAVAPDLRQVYHVLQGVLTSAVSAETLSTDNAPDGVADRLYVKWAKALSKVAFDVQASNSPLIQDEARICNEIDAVAFPRARLWRGRE